MSGILEWQLRSSRTVILLPRYTDNRRRHPPTTPDRSSSEAFVELSISLAVIDLGTVATEFVRMDRRLLKSKYKLPVGQLRPFEADDGAIMGLYR